MEYKELSTITANLETYLPFGLVRNEDGNIFCAISRTSAQILELNYQHHHDGPIRFIQTSVAQPTHMPSKDIAKDYNGIYGGAESRHRNDMQLDPILIPKVLHQAELTFAMIAARFAPRLPKQNGYYLACLSNYGGCNVMFKKVAERSWTTVCELSQWWSAHCRRKYTEPLLNFADLRKYASDTHLTALCWNNAATENELQLCMVNALGTVVFIGLVPNFNVIAPDVTVKILLEKDTNLKKVNTLQWITFVDKQKKTHSFIILGDLIGNVTMFPVTISSGKSEIFGLGEGINMSDECDRVRANGVIWMYDLNAEHLTVVYCKGPHVFAHLLDKTGKPLSQCVHYIEGLSVTGIHALSTTEFVVGTLDACLERLTICTRHKQISISSSTVRHNIDASKNLLYGLTGSTNNAFLLSAQHIAQPYDHLRYRKTSTIAIHHEKNVNALETLLHNANDHTKLKLDFAELFRCQQSEEDAYADYFENSPTPIKFDDAYLYSLKVRMIATSARSTYLRRRGQISQADFYFNEFGTVKKLFFAIRSCCGIKHLLEINEKLTEFQALSLRCQRNFVRGFLNADLSANYESLRRDIQPEVELLLTESEEACAEVVEKCVYCEAEIESGKLMCNENHDLPRCCLSMTQVPLLNYKSCMKCFIIVHDDQEKLKQLFADNITQVNICPMCDLPFYGYPFTAETPLTAVL